jgi:hypothetical protein
MVNRPKQIGTATETAVTRLANLSGFPFAERRALAGAADKGDILMCPGFILEVKGGHMAEKASDAQVLNWLIETENERVNSGAAHSMLIVKRKGVGAERCRYWSAWMWADEWFRDERTEMEEWPIPHVPIRMQLEHAFRVARYFGYGEPMEPK